MSEHDELAANHDVLCRRIAALDRDISLALDREQRVVLQDRRSELVAQRDALGAQLALAGWRQDTHDTKPVDAQQMMDARLQTTETTLRGLDAKMDRLIDQVHDIDTRQKLLEAQVADMKSQIAEVRSQVVATRMLANPDIPRSFLLAGGIAVLLALVMLVIITWRVM